LCLINEELKLICELSPTSTFNETPITLGHHSCSLFIENNLYPQFNIYVDTNKLIDTIKELTLRIAPNNVISPRVIVAEDVNLKANLYKLCKSNTCLDCEVKSGISTEGVFWLQLISCDDVHFQSAGTTATTTKSGLEETCRLKENKQKLNFFIEEINKYVRRKRIGDSQWSTYAELEREPVVDEKCFFLEPITRKWMRARVTAIDTLKKQAQVRLMDTGQQIPAFFSLDNLIEWKNFDLSKIAARSIRCVLYNEESVEDKHEKDICLETKFKFKDLTANLSLKCVIVEPLNKKNENVEEAELQEEFNEENDQQIWIVKLYKQEDFKEILDFNNNTNNDENNTEKVTTKESQSINRCVIEFNRDEKNSNNEGVIDKEMRCVDIRVSEGKFVSKKIMLKTGPEPNEVISSGNF
jgi:hypothetical protein